MLNALTTRIFGSRNDRLVGKMSREVQQINDLEESLQALTDEDLLAKTAEFRSRHEDGESLEKLLPEAFACVREASVRTLGLRHFDVQG